MDLITSQLIPVRHGFPTRAGGCSEGAFASLNASSSGGDAPAAVERNLALLAKAAGVERRQLFGTTQVHGDRVVEAPVEGQLEADALWTGKAGQAVGVKTADCIPLLLCDPVGKRVAAVHAGWKGTLAEIACRAVEALGAAGTRAGDLRAAIGPCIRPCCYQVGDELAARFAADFGAGVVSARDGRPHLDLGACVRASLARAGVGQIDDLALCTACDPRFFSHRRDRGLTGRHLSFITCAFEGPHGPGATVL